MSLKDYVSDEALEAVVKSVVMLIVLPALDKLVADTENAYDDAALAIAKPMLLSLVDKIDGEVG